MPEETGTRPPESAPGAEGHKAEAHAAPAAAPKGVPPAEHATAAAATATADPTPRPILPLQDLMYGLIYPGVLGTGLVLSGQRATKEASIAAALTDPALWVAAAAGLFFAASFASVFEEPQKKNENEEWYGWWPFVIDSVEVVLMFACFYFLGLFEVPNVPPPELHWAYGLLIVEIWWQCLWRWSITGAVPLMGNESGRDGCAGARVDLRAAVPMVQHFVFTWGRGFRDHLCI